MGAHNFQKTLAGVVVLLALAGGVLIGRSQSPLTKVLMAGSRTTSGATNSEATTRSQGVADKVLAEKLAQAQSDLAVATTLDGLSITNRPDGLSLQETVLRRGLLERLVRLFEQQMSFTAELETVKGRRADLAHEAQSWTGFAEPRPHSILLTDALSEGIQVERLEIASGESALTMLAKLMEEQEILLKQAEERIRRLNEKLEAATDAKSAGELTWPREIERPFFRL